MKNEKKFHQLSVIFFFALMILLTACNRPSKSENPATLTEETPDTIQDQITATFTPTLPPLAATVNGEGITLEFINNEILRYLMAYPDSSVSDAFDVVIQNQIDLILLAQAARSAGYSVTDTELDERVNALISQLGSAEQLDQWMAENHYTATSFRQALELSIISEYERNVISSSIPDEVEQVELRQLLVYDETTAHQIQDALNANTDFDWLVSQYHPATRGYLGWQAPGTLLQPALEDTAFSLEPGQVSEAIQTDYGYHFLKVINKEIHPLSIQNKQMLEQMAIEQWIANERDHADINIIATVEN